jgi:hypothetical protein
MTKKEIFLVGAMKLENCLVAIKCLATSLVGGKEFKSTSKFVTKITRMNTMAILSISKIRKITKLS